MEQVLNKNEVDALLNAVNDGLVEPGEGREIDPSQIRSYDLTSQDRVITERMPALEVINDRMSRALRVTLSNYLRRHVDVAVKRSGLTKFGEFLSELGGASCINLFRPTPLRGAGLLAVDPSLFFTLLALLFGSRRSESQAREFTEFTAIEQRIARRIAELVLRDMGQCWSRVVDLAPEFLRTEVNPRFVSIVPSTDVVLRVAFRVGVDETEGEIALVIPFASIEGLRRRLAQTSPTEESDADPSWQRRLRGLILDTPAAVTAEFGRAAVTVRDLVELQAGEVILLDRNTGDPANLLVEGQPKFVCQPVIYRGALAIQVCGAESGKELSR